MLCALEEEVERTSLIALVLRKWMVQVSVSASASRLVEKYDDGNRSQKPVGDGVIEQWNGKG